MKKTHSLQLTLGHAQVKAVRHRNSTQETETGLKQSSCSTKEQIQETSRQYPLIRNRKSSSRCTSKHTTDMPKQTKARKEHTQVQQITSKQPHKTNMPKYKSSSHTHTHKSSRKAANGNIPHADLKETIIKTPQAPQSNLNQTCKRYLNLAEPERRTIQNVKKTNCKDFKTWNKE